MGQYSDAISRLLRKPTLAAIREYLGIGAGGLGGTVTEVNLSFSDVTTANSTSVQHGLLPKLSGNAAEVLNGVGGWIVPSGGGDVVGPAGAAADNVAIFNGATGKIIKDGGFAASRIPTQGENDALAGTNGVPSAANPYVTDSDPRNTNTRAPTAHATSHQNGGADEISVAGLSGALADAQTPTAHAASHSSAGGDPVTITNLAGFPGGGTTFLRDDGTFAAPPGGGSGLTQAQVLARTC